MMSIKKLIKYLDSIDCGKPINLQKFIGLLKQQSLFHTFHPSDLTGRKANGSLYYITDINKELNIELRNLIQGIGNDRVSSARQNHSHDHKVNGSLLLVREGNLHPSVVLFDVEGKFSGFNQRAKYALLIENREVFLSIDKTFAFLGQQVGLNFDHPVDVIFTVGNEISNSLHREFLNHYKKLYLFFDLDLGGLSIAKNLNALVPEIPKDFLVPKDIESRLSKVVEKQTAEAIDQVIKIGFDDPLLTPYAKLIKDHQRVLEQESYLYDE